MKYTTVINDQMFEVEIQRDGSVLVNGKRHEVDFLEMEHGQFSIITDNKSLELAINENQGQYEVLLEGRLYEVQVLDQRAMLMLNRKGGLKLDSGEVIAPMPGLIVEVLVSVGDTVNEDDTLVILESMKMQNELKTPCSGIIENILCNTGDSVDKNQLLIVVAPPAEADNE